MSRNFPGRFSTKTMSTGSPLCTVGCYWLPSMYKIPTRSPPFWVDRMLRRSPMSSKTSSNTQFLCRYRKGTQKRPSNCKARAGVARTKLELSAWKSKQNGQKTSGHCKERPYVFCQLKKVKRRNAIVNGPEGLRA